MLKTSPPGEKGRMKLLSYTQGSLLLGLLVMFTATGWAQTAPEGALKSCAALYRQAVPLMEAALQKLDARQLAEAKSAVTEANALFSRLQKECAPLLTDHALTFKEEQQLAINQKLGDDAQSQGDAIMVSAAAKDKQAREIEAKGQEEAGQALSFQAKKEYEQAQNLFIKAGIYALKNQQIIFQFLVR
jgi:hypothetical protein